MLQVTERNELDRMLSEANRHGAPNVIVPADLLWRLLSEGSTVEIPVVAKPPQTPQTPPDHPGVMRPSSDHYAGRVGMNARENLAIVLRAIGSAIRDVGGVARADASDISELICVLARLVEGKSVHHAFGAPGDWGYETPIGDALADLYRSGWGGGPACSIGGTFKSREVAHD